LASSALKPYTGFANLRVYSPELQRDFRELDVFLKDLRANVGKLLGEVQTTTVDITAVPTSTQVIAGSGLTGGGALTADITLNVGAGTGVSVAANTVGLANTAVTAGDYTLTSLTVDAQGRLTAASSGTAISGANPTASVGLAAVNGVATTYLRSDGAPALSVGIVPTWTGIHTFSAQDVHNAGVSLGTSAVLTSAIADAAAAVSMNYKPGTALTSGGDRFLHAFHDSVGTRYFDIASDGTFFFGTGGATHATGIYMGVGASAITIADSLVLGIKFGPKWGATAGASLGTIANVAAAGQFSCTDNTTATATTLVGGFFSNNSVAARAHTNVIGGLFMAYESLALAVFGHGNLYGWLVKGTSAAMSSTATNSYGGYIENTLTGATPVTTNQYGLVIDEQTKGVTVKNGLLLNSATAGYKCLALGSQSNWLAWESATTFSLNATTVLCKADLDISAKNIATDTTTGTKIATGATQKIGLFGVAPIVQPSAFTQTYSTASHTHLALTAVAVATTAATNIAPYGYTTAAQADAIVTQLNALNTDVLDLKKVVNAIIDDGQALGNLS
jgi:hypothetical protein